MIMIIYIYNVRLFTVLKASNLIVFFITMSKLSKIQKMSSNMRI